MTEKQKRARSKLVREREEAGLSTDIDDLIEYYRGIDPKYVNELEQVIGPSAKKSQG